MTGQLDAAVAFYADRLATLDRAILDDRGRRLNVRHVTAGLRTERDHLRALLGAVRPAEPAARAVDCGPDICTALTAEAIEAAGHRLGLSPHQELIEESA